MERNEGIVDLFAKENLVVVDGIEAIRTFDRQGPRRQ